MFRYSLRTLLIVLALAPPVLAIAWWLLPRITQRRLFLFGPWELIIVGVVVFVLFGHHIPSMMRTFFRDFYT